MRERADRATRPNSRGLERLQFRVAVLLLVLGVALVVVIVAAREVLVRDRDELLARLASDRAHQLDEARVEIEAELGGVVRDLQLAARLAARADSVDDIEREIDALVSVGRYRAAAVRRAGAGPGADAVSEQLSPRERAMVRPAIEQVLLAAFEAPGRVRTSRPVSVDGRSLRVFATASAENPTIGVLLVLDTERLLSRLRIVSADPGTRLLVMGPHDIFAPASDPEATRALERVAAGERDGSRLAELLARLRARDTGTLSVTATDSRLLGIDDHGAVAIYRPIELDGRPAWSTALIASTASIVEHEQAVFRRLVLAVVLIALMLLGLSAFVVLTARRTIALRERLRRADEVAHLHEKANKVLDTIPTCVAVLGAAGEITGANAALARRLPGAAIGAPLAEAFDHADRGVVEVIESLVEAARTSGKTHSIYAEAACVFANEGTYNLHAVPLERRSADAEVLLVIEDLTMTGKLERQLLRSEKLATVGILAAGIAHEVGTPLGAARGRAEYTLGKLAAADDRLAAGQQIIIDQIDHVSRTIRRLLDFSRVRPTTSLEAVDVVLAARGISELLALEADRRGVELRLDLPADCPRLGADPEQLDQVLVNLVMNAFDACDVGGRIELSARAMHNGAETLLLRVSDDGRGMAEHERTQAFEPFFTTKKRGRGTGLGLAIVAQIVRNHGGTVEVDSEIGRGTTVTVRWPAHRAEASG